MKNIIKLEEAAMFGISAYALYLLHAEWWCYPLLGFGPDIGMIGYAVSSYAGAGLYNIFHHKGFAIFIFVIGMYTGILSWEIVGAILFGHSSMDRMFGYGLKYNRGFKYTHLGVIGGKERN
jgi:Domain of unknown function (DUF4260)